MWWMALAAAHTCEDISLEEVVAQAGPAVVVLGERHGSKVDMKRALQVVRALSEKGPVTLAMEAVHESNAGTIEAFAAGEFGAGKLPSKLHWKDTWGHDYKPYKKLLLSSRDGVKIVAAGLELGPKPDDREVPIPDGYKAFMADSIRGHAHAMSDEIRERFHISMAWRDFRIGELAAEGWDGQGYLVVLTGKGHVEGGMGTNWQLAEMVDAPISSVVLHHDGARCLDGDRVWED